MPTTTKRVQISDDEMRAFYKKLAPKLTASQKRHLRDCSPAELAHIARSFPPSPPDFPGVTFGPDDVRKHLYRSTAKCDPYAIPCNRNEIVFPCDEWTPRELSNSSLYISTPESHIYNGTRAGIYRVRLRTVNTACHMLGKQRGILNSQCTREERWEVASTGAALIAILLWKHTQGDDPLEGDTIRTSYGGHTIIRFQGDDTIAISEEEHEDSYGPRIWLASMIRYEFA